MRVKLKLTACKRHELPVMLSRGLILAGLTLIAAVGAVRLLGWRFQQQASAYLAASSKTDSTEPSPDLVPILLRSQYEILGTLTVPRLEFSQVVSTGTGELSLLLGLGHIEGTAQPGAVGNVGIAGHRDTHFRPLKDIQIGDAIRLSTSHRDRLYRVTSTKIVDPTDVDVLAPSIGDALTLVTCYPFYYVGSAPKRFIVRGLPAD